MSALGSGSNNNYGLKQNDIDEINRSFRGYDSDNNGHITRDELKQCLRQASVISSDNIIESVLRQMDLNHDDIITYDEYLRFMSTIYRNEHSDLKRQLGNAGDNVGSATQGLF
jgi:Ca2+-binding EF-hand superfamily protein